MRIYCVALAASVACMTLLSAASSSAQPLRPNRSLPSEVGEPGYVGAITDDRDVQSGVLVLQVLPNTPAESAGLRQGDRIVSIDGRPIRDMDDFQSIILRSRPAARLRLEVERGESARTSDAKQSLMLVLGQRPAGEQRPLPNFGRIAQPDAERDDARLDDFDMPDDVLLGVRTLPLDDKNRRRLSLPVDSGVLISEVFRDSPAAAAGIPVDALIVSIDRWPVRSPESLIAAVRSAGKGRTVELGFYYEGKLHHRRVELGSGSTTRNDPRHGPAERIRFLEQRLWQLERRLEQLERRSYGGTNRR